MASAYESIARDLQEAIEFNKVPKLELTAVSQAAAVWPDTHCVRAAVLRLYSKGVITFHGNE